MKRSKNLLRKSAALAAMSTVLVSQAPLINAFAYGEADVSQSTFKQDTDNSADFQNWLSNVWQGGEKAYAQTENIALTPGSDAADLNFSWYSAGKGTPAVKVWKDGSKSSAKVVTGNAEAISAENWQGKSYSAANKVNIADYFEENTQYHYQYTDNYTGDDSVWSAEYDYTTKATDKFSVILTGDPQVGASWSSHFSLPSCALFLLYHYTTFLRYLQKILHRRACGQNPGQGERKGLCTQAHKTSRITSKSRKTAAQAPPEPVFHPR